jgi:hypothetical protein
MQKSSCMTNATDRDTRQIVHHLLGSDGIEPDCLPFPAGPLVPRQQTQAPPLIQHHLKAADRVALAYLLWPEETGGQHRDKAAYTGTLDRLHLLSSRAWYLMHQQNPKPQATAMVEAWFHLLRKDPSRSQQQFDIWRRKVRTVVVNRLRVSRTPATLGKETSEPGASLAVAAASVTRDFLDIFGVSMLLQRFWFKQFHARRRFVWEKSESKASIHPTHDAALKMLQRIESQAGHPLAPTAAALCSPGLVPGKDYPAASWTDQLRSAHCVGRALPDCFCPFLPRVHAHYKASGQLDPAPAAVNLQQAQRIWREIGRSPDELYAVDALAGEVAYSMEGQYTPEKAYAPPAYTCTCHATKVEYKGPLSANCGHVAAAMNYLKHGKWSLLQRFWFKQLHSHTGFCGRM